MHFRERRSSVGQVSSLEMDSAQPCEKRGLISVQVIGASEL